MSERREISDETKLLSIITFLLVAFALKQTYAVTMPLSAAAVIIAAVWPVKPWLRRFAPESVSTIGVLLLLLALLLAFAGAVSFAVSQIASAFSRNGDKLQQLYQNASDWAQSWGVSPGDGAGYGRLLDIARQGLASAYNVFVYLGIVVVLIIFGVPEVSALRKKLERKTSEGKSSEILRAVDETAFKVRQYLWVTTLTSFITGTACLMWSFLMGLDLALVWGLLNFLLNYIPVVGNFIGVVPPTLYAFVQFGGWHMPLLVFGGFATIQTIISNFVAPTLQGRSLALSPMAVIVALSFWSWIWGIAGALIAVPLTSAIVVACTHFDRVSWISTILCNDDDPARAP